MDRKISVSEITIKLTEENKESALSFRTKIELAKMLDNLGVSVIETGPILNGKKDSLLIKSLASVVNNSTLAVPVDITSKDSVEQTWNSLKEAKHPRLQVSVPVSVVQMEYLCHKKPEAIIALVADLTKQCAAYCKDVEFIAGDFGRSEQEFLSKAIDAAVEAGATTITVCDTAGKLFPEEFYDSLKAIRKAIPQSVKLGVWCCNDLHMADSCAIAAVRAGADEIKTTTYLNSTVSIKRFTKILEARADVCHATCDVKMTQLQRSVDQIKLLCDPKKRSVAMPLADKEERDAINLTVHDDYQSVMKSVSKLGYDLSEDDGTKVYDAFLRLAAKNDIIEAKELDAIVASVAFQAPPTYKLESYVINSGNVISATCHLRLRKEDELLESVCLSDGPVDAAFKAIEKLVDRQYELDDFQIQSVTEGREAMGEAVVRLRYEGRLFSGRGISTDIVGSSILAYLNAVNKIAFEEGQI